jgi:hypothetical protein
MHCNDWTAIHLMLSARQLLAEGSSEQAASNKQAQGIRQVNNAVIEMDKVAMGSPPCFLGVVVNFQTRNAV